MAYINLLPWREEALKVKQKEFFTLLTAVGLCAFALTFAVNLYFQARIDGQTTRNQFIKNDHRLFIYDGSCIFKRAQG